MFLNFLVPSIDVGEEDDHAAPATVVKVLPGRWIEVIIGAAGVLETELAAAEALPLSNLFVFKTFYFKL